MGPLKGELVFRASFLEDNFKLTDLRDRRSQMSSSRLGSRVKRVKLKLDRIVG